MSLYLDSSALVKLLAEEPESGALRAFVARAATALVSSQIATVEVPRAARRHDVEELGRELLDTLIQIDLETGILEVAASVSPAELSSLDALHLASALAHRERIDTFVAYDARLAAAARASGFEVAAPR